MVLQFFETAFVRRVDRRIDIRIVRSLARLSSIKLAAAWDDQWMLLPPMPLLRIPSAFDKRNWLFELRHDGLRSIAAVAAPAPHDAASIET